MRKWIFSAFLLLMAFSAAFAAAVSLEEAEFRLVERLFTAGRNTEALTEALEYASKRPSSPFTAKALLMAGKAGLASGDVKAAESALQMLSRLPAPEAERRQGHFALAEAEGRLGKTAESALLYSDFARLYPDSPAAASSLKFAVKAYAAVGRTAEAEAQFRLLSSRFSGSAQEAEARKYLAAEPFRILASSSPSFAAVSAAASSISGLAPVKDPERLSGRVGRNSLPTGGNFFEKRESESAGGKLRTARASSSSDRSVINEPSDGLRDRNDGGYSAAAASSAPSREEIVYREVPVYITNAVVTEVTNQVYESVFETNLATNFSTNWVVLTNSWEVTNIFFATNLLESVISNMTFMTNTIYEKVMLTNTVSNEFIQTNLRKVVMSNRLILTNMLTNRFLLTNVLNRELITTNRIVVSNGLTLTQMVSVLDSNALLIEKEQREAERRQEEMARYQSLLELRARLLELKQKAIDSKKDIIQQGNGGDQ